MAIPRISLCMIAKDEEEWIAQCIRSVLPIVAEIILVDTGSTDRTVAIAESLGAKVLHQPWEDDFSKPRNLSIAEATGDWILVLDADEAIAERDHPEFLAMTSRRDVCWEFLQRHYTHDHRLSDFAPIRGDYPDWEAGQVGYFESNCVRLFPHGEGLSYRGRVHELVEHSIREVGRHRVVRTQVRIHHFGHTRKVREKKNKGKLYSPLGEQKIQEEPTNWQAFFELGVEHNVNRRLEESVVAFNRAIEMNPTYLSSWVNRGYVLCELGRYVEAERDLREAIRLDPSASEAFCNLGVVGMRTTNGALAEQSFLRALEINPLYVNALMNLGKVYAMAGRLSDAAMVYRRAIAALPASGATRVDLGSVYLQGGIFSEAERYLREGIALDPKLARAHFNLAQLYHVTARGADRRAALREFLAVQETQHADPELEMFVPAVRQELEERRESR